MTRAKRCTTIRQPAAKPSKVVKTDIQCWKPTSEAERDTLYRRVWGDAWPTNPSPLCREPGMADDAAVSA
jgi:hypothetical protein